MNDSELQIEEKYAPYWIWIAVGLAVLTLGLLMVYYRMEDPYWSGMVRLAAFAGLAGTVFSALKVMQGKHTINMAVKDRSLSITYRKNGREVAHDLFAFSGISSVYFDNHASFMGESFFVKDLNILFIPSDDPESRLSLIEVNGRPLALSREDARRVADLIHRHAPGVGIPDLD